MSVTNRQTRFLIIDTGSLVKRDGSIEESGKGFKVGLLLLRTLFCFLLIVFSSFYILNGSAIAGKAEEIKEEVKQGVQETKEELKKMPEELKKVGNEMKKKSEDVKKGIEDDIEQGKKNIQSITK